MPLGLALLLLQVGIDCEGKSMGRPFDADEYIGFKMMDDDGNTISNSMSDIEVHWNPWYRAFRTMREMTDDVYKEDQIEDVEYFRDRLLDKYTANVHPRKVHNTFIKACAKAHLPDRAASALKYMTFCPSVSARALPNARSYRRVVEACVGSGDIERAERWLRRAFEKQRLRKGRGWAKDIAEAVEAVMNISTTNITRQEYWISTLLKSEVSPLLRSARRLIRAAEAQADKKSNRALSWLQKLSDSTKWDHNVLLKDETEPEKVLGDLSEALNPKNFDMRWPTADEEVFRRDFPDIGPDFKAWLEADLDVFRNKTTRKKLSSRKPKAENLAQSRADRRKEKKERKIAAAKARVHRLKKPGYQKKEPKKVDPKEEEERFKREELANMVSANRGILNPP